MAGRKDVDIRIAVTGLRGVPATWGGIEHHCEQIYSRLAARGHDITIYARRHYVPGDIQIYNVMTIKKLPTLRTKYTEAFLHTLFSFLHVITTNPDIVHVHAQGPSLFSWIPRLLRPGMRVFFTCHGLDWQRRKWPPWAAAFIRTGEICSVLFPHCRIVVSRQLQQYYRERYGTRTAYIPNGVTVSDDRAPQHIEKFGLSARGYFLFVGRVVPEKRLEDTLQAFLCRPRSSKLVIVGESAGADDYMQRLRRAAGDSPAVLFLGYRYGEELEALYANARAFVNASEVEGLPLTVLEALAHAAACIVSDIPPHREAAGEGGFLFPAGRVEALAERMDELESLPADRIEALGREAADRVAREFNWDTAAEKLERLYRESLSGQELRQD